MLTKICVIEKRKKMSFIKSTSFEFMKKDKISNVYCLSQVSENSESLEKSLIGDNRFSQRLCRPFSSPTTVRTKFLMRLSYWTGFDKSVEGWDPKTDR